LTSVEIHIITNYLHLDCAEHGIRKSFYPPQRVRVQRLSFNHSVTKPVNMIHRKCWFSCICNRRISYLFWKLV